MTDAGYGIRTERSREILERLERSIPGGNTRSLAFFPPHPLVISSGTGYRIRDADGNEFIDLLNNYTASIHGHALPAINEAMSKQAALGTVFPAPGGLQAELAEPCSTPPSTTGVGPPRKFPPKRKRHPRRRSGRRRRCRSTTSSTSPPWSTAVTSLVGFEFPMELWYTTLALLAAMDPHLGQGAGSANPAA